MERPVDSTTGTTPSRAAALVGWRLLAQDPPDGGWHTSRTGVRYRFRTLERDAARGAE